MQKFKPSNSSLHKYAFGAVMASASIFSHFNVLAFSNSDHASKTEIEAMFMELDTNHDHKLSHDESSRDWEIEPKFNKADFNGDGVLELSEYLNFKNAMQISSGVRDKNSVGSGLVINGSVIKA